MGNTPPSAAVQQDTVKEAVALFQEFDSNADKVVSAGEWEQAFAALDKNCDAVVSRKEWCLRHGSTYVFDACRKKVDAQITQKEWMQAFTDMDTNANGVIDSEEWLARRPVHLGFTSIGMGLYHWGVGVGDDFYELLAWGRTATEMVAAGPTGIVACGEFVEEPGRREQWVEKARHETKAGKRPAETWSEGKQEPCSRPMELWGDLESCGGTSKSDAEIEAWIRKWVEEHPIYCAVDAFGGECNDHTFANDLITWLTGIPHQRTTDNQRGRSLLYGGVALLAGVGAMYLWSAQDTSTTSCGVQVAAAAVAAVAVAAVAEPAAVAAVAEPADMAATITIETMGPTSTIGSMRKTSTVGAMGQSSTRTSTMQPRQSSRWLQVPSAQ